MESKHTAVEWLEQEFIALQNYGINELGLFAKAKEMEKEQIKEAFYSGYEDRDLFQHSDDYYDKMYERNDWQGI